MSEGVRGILVGESLMRSPNPASSIRELLSLPTPPESKLKRRTPLVKICGVTSVQDAITAAREGADMIGMVFVGGSKRCVSLETARAITLAVKQLGSVSNDLGNGRHRLYAVRLCAEH